MIDRTIHQYKILEKIGSGGMGTVYKALDTKLDRFVALKFLALHLSQAEEEKKRFVHEAKAISALDALPEVNVINYITHVKIPTLMLNGKYDMILPYDKAIKPMYDLLGTPKKDKKLILYETDHISSQKEFIKETLAWLDKYLGPVK